MTSGFEVWEQIFHRLSVVQEVGRQGLFFITSKDLNEISKPLGGPDARNLVKYDHKKQLPPPFLRNKLAILPVARGEFIIGSFDIYAPLEDKNLAPLRSYQVPLHLETLKKMASETDSLVVAQHSGALDDFLREEVIFVGGGKDSGPGFSMSVKGTHAADKAREVYVKKGVTIEIDGLYESKSFIVAVEAKMKAAVDFNVRQLYYPYRSLTERYAKPIRTVYLSVSNGIFDAREFVFSQPGSISSYREATRQRFTFSRELITRAEVAGFAATASSKTLDHSFPVPQADNLERVIDLAERLVLGPMSKKEISAYYGFHSRQSDYYANAAGYLGLAIRVGSAVWGSTKLAEHVFSKGFKERNLELISLVLAQSATRLAYRHYLNTGTVPGAGETLEILRDSGELSRISGSTVPRRVSTVRGWVRWLLSMQMD